MADKIGENVILKMMDMATEQLRSYTEDLNQAYRLAGGDALKITSTFKLKPGDGVIDIESSLSFVKERVVDKTEGSADEDQQNLFDGGNNNE